MSESLALTAAHTIKVPLIVMRSCRRLYLAWIFYCLFYSSIRVFFFRVWPVSVCSGSWLSRPHWNIHSAVPEVSWDHRLKAKEGSQRPGEGGRTKELLALKKRQSVGKARILRLTAGGGREEVPAAALPPWNGPGFWKSASHWCSRFISIYIQLNPYIHIHTVHYVYTCRYIHTQTYTHIHAQTSCGLANNNNNNSNASDRLTSNKR